MTLVAQEADEGDATLYACGKLRWKMLVTPFDPVLRDDARPIVINF